MTTIDACDRIREELEAFHYGDLEGPERGAVERHLVGCPACRAALEAVRETAASLDTVPVPPPSELDWARFDARLESRVAPLRARRMAFEASGFSRYTRYARVAAAFLIGGLLALSGGLFLQTRGQAQRIGALERSLAEAAWRDGDMHAYAALVKASDTQSHPHVAARLKIADEVEPEVAKIWALSRQAVTEEDARERISELLANFPKHPLADQAFIALEKTGMPTPPPLERALLNPVPLGPAPTVAGETREQFARLRVAKLRAYAASSDPKSGAFALFRAGRIAEEELKDGKIAAELYDAAAARIPAGRIQEAALEGAARVRTGR
jgi:hypothetical protein